MEEQKIVKPLAVYNVYAWSMCLSAYLALISGDTVPLLYKNKLLLFITYSCCQSYIKSLEPILPHLTFVFQTLSLL